MADPKVRIDKELKERMVEEVRSNPEYSSQKAFVNKAVRRLLDSESMEFSEEQKKEIRDLVREELE
jgi:Arc/MetJ-type ribon-helix-helix transcriptional regulator